MYAADVGRGRMGRVPVLADAGQKDAGEPEPLKNKLSGWWSRRIDSANRIVYREENGTIFIAQCKGHYDD